MKVQTIQPNIQKPCFQAKFINDRNGYFRKLWQDAEFNTKFYQTVDKFADNNKEHSLEIIDMSNGTFFEIFNHRNGYSRKYTILNTPNNNKLQALLDKILSGDTLFNEGFESIKAYQKLTGQAVDKGIKI